MPNFTVKKYEKNIIKINYKFMHFKNIYSLYNK